MALSPEERQLGAALKKSGKTNTEIARIIANRRAKATTPEQPQEDSSPSYSQGVSQAYQSGISKIEQGRETAQQGNTLIETIPGATKAAAGTIEALSSPVAPLFAPVANAFKSATDYLSETPFFKGYGEDTANLPADETNTGEQILDFASDLGVVAGTASGPKGVTAVASKAKSALTAAREALAPLPEGSAGIQAAREAGTMPESLMQRVARIPKGKQADFEQTAGVPVGKYLVDRGIFGTPDKIVEQLYNRFQQSKGEADKALATLKGNYKNSAVGGMLKELGDRERSISSVGAPSKDLQRVIALDKKMKGEGLSMTEINEVKRLYERNVKLEFMKDPSKLGQNVARANNLDSAVREWQMSMARQLGLKNLDEINKETRLARQLADDLGAEYSGSAGNNAISITDWIALSGGSAANIGMFLTKQALTSKTVMSKAAELMAGSTPKVAAPKAEISAPTIDNYKKFLDRTDPKAQGGGPNNAMNTVNVAPQSSNPTVGAWPTTASKPSKAGVTSTGSAPTGKGGVSAQKAGTSGPFDGGDYRYHFTNAKNLDSIAKTGLEPRGYGDVYFAPNEKAASGYGGASNQLKLRIKRDALPEDYFEAIGDDAVKRGGSALGEGRTKQPIPPEALEVFKDGKWQPLKGSSPSIPKELEPLAAEARKWTPQQRGMAEDAVKQAKAQGATVTDEGNIVLYHGTRNGRAPKEGDMWRSNTYFTTDEKTAMQFAQQGEGGKPIVMRVEIPPHKVFAGKSKDAYWALNEEVPVRFYNKATGGTPKGAKP